MLLRMLVGFLRRRGLGESILIPIPYLHPPSSYLYIPIPYPDPHSHWPEISLPISQHLRGHPPRLPPAPPVAVPEPGSACSRRAIPAGGSIARRVPPPARCRVNPPPKPGEAGLR